MVVRVWHQTFALVVALLLGTAATAGAQAAPVGGGGELEEEARIHFMAGRAHYEKGAFLEAATEFEAAYKISGHTKLLYNVYLAYRDGDALAEAARALREYLEKDGVIENRQQLEARLKVLESRQAATTGPTPMPAPAPVAEPAPAPAPPPPEKPNHTVSWVLMGVGGALAIASIPMFVIAGGAGSDLDDLCSADHTCAPQDAAKAQDLSDKGKTFTAVSYGLLATGVATAGVGLVLLLTSSGGAEEAPPPVALGCHATGCYGSATFKF